MKSTISLMLEHDSLRLLYRNLYFQYKKIPWWKFKKRNDLKNKLNKTYIRACVVFEEALSYWEKN